ncbi:MAG: regulatory iron-sulfur-containing complex subunit RicT [Roseiflexaceae bacterium]|nr:hypothetical protein [Chloroflexaceae bacterium]
MPTVVGIRFKDSGKTYYFDPARVSDITQGQYVIVETARGLEMARVAELPHEVDESVIVGELKPVIRPATDEDDIRWKQLNSRQEELLRRCQEKIDEHQLPMGLVKAEYSFDGSRLTFYFTADKRVDFRNLVRDLARTFRTRIELRQIGPRDEAKLLGGIGPCGRILCCASFLPDYARVSIKMAKDQDLPLNPSKISGVCGRLLCCLAYEHEQYIEMKAELPRRGMWVQTPEGPGEVVVVNVLRGTVTVLLASSGIQEEFSPEIIQETTAEVASQARARTAEGVTPVSRERNRGERRLLREEFESSDMLAALAALEDKPDDHARTDDVGAAVRQRPPHGNPGGPRGNFERRGGDNRPPRPDHSGGRSDERRGGDNRPPRPQGDRPNAQQRPSTDTRPPRPQGDRPSLPPERRRNQGDAPGGRDERRGGDNQPTRPQGDRPNLPPERRQPRPSAPAPGGDDAYSVPQVPPNSAAAGDNERFRRRRRPNAPNQGNDQGNDE